MSLTNAQMQILRMFDKNLSEQELLELRQVLSEFLANKLTKSLEQECIEKGYTREIIDSWKDEHFRTPYK